MKISYSFSRPLVKCRIIVHGSLSYVFIKLLGARRFLNDAKVKAAELLGVRVSDVAM